MKHKPAMYALLRLHSEIGAELLANRKERARLAANMRHVEAVIQLLEPGYDVRSIAVKRRNKSNPWFKRGTLFRGVLDILRAADAPLTVTEICHRLLAAREATATRKQMRGLSEAVRSSLKNHTGKSVAHIEGSYPARWILLRLR